MQIRTLIPDLHGNLGLVFPICMVFDLFHRSCWSFISGEMERRNLDENAENGVG